ncbi:MAG: secretin N-terminal domain-containing protein [Candidatus Omnitrophota bacterium]
MKMWGAAAVVAAVIAGIFFRVESAQAVDAAAPAATGADAIPAAAVSIPMEERMARKISLDLRDMNIVDVLKFLAIKGDFNILTSKNIEGRVTLLLNSVSIKDALEIILIANDLAYIQKTGIVYVQTAAEYLAMNGKKFSDSSKVKIVYLKYARPSYVLTALQNIRSNFGKIVIDEDTGTVVMIDTEEKLQEMSRAINEMEHKNETKVITLMYAKAEVVANQLKARLDAKSVGSIQFDERSNQIIISALSERMAEIESIVKALDTKTKAVLLEAAILQVTLNPSYNQGINWEKAFANAKNKLLKSLDFVGAFPIASTVSSTAVPTAGKLAVGNISVNDFTVELQLLKQVQATKLLANPRIMAINNQESKIHIGDTVPYITSTTTGTGDTATTSEAVNWINVGIQLVVTPTINDNGMVSIKIKPEISSKIGDYKTPKGATIPIVNTTLVETSVLVKDGNTIIIGGLVKNDKSSITSGIPGLMNAPLIGGLFKSVSDSVTNAEIVIFITPHIMGGETEIPGQKGEILGLKDY